MKKPLLLLTITCLLLFVTGCFSITTPTASTPATSTTSTTPPPDTTVIPDFNLIYKHGIPEASVDILDTFNGTYTMLEPLGITIDFILTDEEMNRIHKKMVEIDFFNYPDEFTVTPYVCDNCSQVMQANFYYSFYVEYGSKIKELTWNDVVPIPFLIPTFDNPLQSDNGTGFFSLDPEEMEERLRIFEELTTPDEYLESYMENDLYWITNEDEQAYKLRELTILIRDIIKSKKEFKDLPFIKKDRGPLL